MSNSRKRKTGGAFRRTTRMCGLYAKSGKDRTSARRGRKEKETISCKSPGGYAGNQAEREVQCSEKPTL